MIAAPTDQGFGVLSDDLLRSLIDQQVGHNMHVSVIVLVFMHESCRIAFWLPRRAHPRILPIMCSQPLSRLHGATARHSPLASVSYCMSLLDGQLDLSGINFCVVNNHCVSCSIILSDVVDHRGSRTALGLRP